mmetsp:Transcript_8482/g.12276  ORF Transcript_8482/g.12276 Transcript_8482/m.12276 type:complete len:138 (-) Transcript_8482:171-584(-)
MEEDKSINMSAAEKDSKDEVITVIEEVNDAKVAEQPVAQSAISKARSKHRQVPKALLKERDKLLEMQELKRRRREDTAAQGRRSKELKEGQTPLKQKVERLKRERRLVQNEYEDTGGTMKKRKQKRKKHNIPLPQPS